VAPAAGADPATWTLIVTGFGAAGVVLRHRLVPVPVRA